MLIGIVNYKRGNKQRQKVQSFSIVSKVCLKFSPNCRIGSCEAEPRFIPLVLCRRLVYSMCTSDIVSFPQIEDETQVSRATQAEQDHYEMHVRAANIVSICIII